MQNEKIYEAAVDLSNKNNSHTIMVQFILESNRKSKARVLEVGCATGFFGAFLKEQGFEVWGVETSVLQAKRAGRRLDYVYIGCIEDFLRSDECGNAGYFDYIVFGDVLEHLANPTEVLKSCAGILAPDGAILASIPNVAHLAVRLMLLEGRWEYAPFGILDDTHLRFFTRRSIVELFSTAGYCIENMYAVRLSVEDAGIEVNRELLEGMKHLIVDDEQDVFQFVVMATKRLERDAVDDNARFIATKPLRILCLLPIEDWSLGNIRIRNPLRAWQSIYAGEVRTKSIVQHTMEDIAWADVVVLQRESNIFTLKLIRKIQQLDKPIIFDMDDLLSDPPPFLTSYNAMVERKKDLEVALGAVDAISVTTSHLQEKMKVYNRNVYIVPNCASSDYTPAQHYYSEDNLVKLIVASTDTVRVDFILRSLRRLQHDPDLNLRIIGVGPPGEYLAESGLDVKCYDNMDYEGFKKFLSAMDNAIGLIPLDDSPFSACKSAIKYVDYAIAGIPAVCSAVPPYSDVIQDGVTGVLVPNTEEEWFQAVKRLALSVNERKRILASAREYCLSRYSMKVAAEKWNQVFADVKPGQGKIVEERMLKSRLRFRAVKVVKYGLKPGSYVSLMCIISSEARACVRNIYARIIPGLDDE